MDEIWPVLAVAAVTLVVGVVLVWLVRHRHDLGRPADHATFRILHTASLASPPLRNGLTPTSAERSVRHLRALLGAPAVALTDRPSTLCWDGVGEHHRDGAPELAEPVVAEGHARRTVPSRCAAPRASARCGTGIVAPLTVEDRVVGTLQVYAPSASARPGAGRDRGGAVDVGPARARRARPRHAPR